MNREFQSLMEDVEQREEELIELVKELIAFQTPAPPARNTADAQLFVASFLKKHGFHIDMWDVYPGDPNVVGVLKGTDSNSYNSLIINGHMDVAEVNADENWGISPFQAEIKGDVIIGRGTADMKGGLAASLFAIQLLREAGLDLPGDVIFESVIGEEVGEAGTLQCCERGYTADFALIADTSNLHIQGQGGVITGWITVKSSQTFHDATRKNMIHAGGNIFGANAIEKMMKIMNGLQELERHWAVTKGYPGFPPGANTINPAVIEGGRNAAFIADECRLWVTVHFYPNESYEQIIKEIEEHIINVAKGDPWLKEHLPCFEWGGTSMIEDRGEVFPAFEIETNHPAIRLLANSHNEVTGKNPVIDVSPTVTDGGWLADAGIPSALYGPGQLEHAHSVNEQVSIQQLIEFTKVVLRFIYEWVHTKKGA
ncbi:acetylornithine deacetylase [Peribacillus cavernae]|uniref:Acetylornithine deacetylase n=1 Tax=Peribacillus cavernae TaxID=1674310 RepID=A0A3S0TZQ9_9BACI|nr:acetylornithine deacetylase [Peribacillus cavernae]MDQ0220674.1 acetylornithine deacetylase [Peribacillus cavernae]RUQ31127.1 acetylornithine deacetylase [Peribacillus cavernae]